MIQDDTGGGRGMIQGEEDTQDEDASENALEESAVSSQDSSWAFTFDEQNTTSVQLQNASPEKLGITSPEKSNEDSEDLKLPVNEDTWEETIHDPCVFHSA